VALKKLTVIKNPVDYRSWEEYECENIADCLASLFDDLPQGARIYQGVVCAQSDVTPLDEAGVERLLSLPGPFYCVVYPNDPITIGVSVIVALVASVAMAVLFKPSIPQVAERNQQSTSPNNELSARSNKARPKARIPDIFGTVRSTPDLLAVPYSIFDNNIEVELGLMCIGRGQYEIHDARDGETAIADIEGASIQVYKPNTTITPSNYYFKIGDQINEPLYNIKKSNSVNGQVLDAPNAALIPGTGFGGYGRIEFKYPNLIHNTDGVEDDPIRDFRKIFHVGDLISISGATRPSTLENFDGIYQVTVVNFDYIGLLNPASVNPAWNNIVSMPGQATGNTWATLQAAPSVDVKPPSPVGPFVLDDPKRTIILLNIVAMNGLYKENNENLFGNYVEFEVTVQQIDSSRQYIGSPLVYTHYINGNGQTKGTIAETIRITTPFTGACTVMVKRTTPRNVTFEGNVVDEIKWRDLISLSPVTNTNFGNVTIIRSRTVATPGALSVKERKLNMLVTRQIKQRLGTSGQVYTATLESTNYLPDIFAHIAQDKYIGNLMLSNLDVDGIYGAASNIVSYFGTPTAAEFCYTFDKDNISLEETIATICNACFCIAYRLGNVIKVNFEKLDNQASILFNHRNKIPNSEKRSVRFGWANDNDGIELTYVSPVDDAVLTYYVPEDRSAINPKKIETAGVRSKVVAHFHAWRHARKILLQHEFVEFDATQEADLVIPNDRILVANNIKQETQDGEITYHTGNVVKTSQSVSLIGGSYTAYFQLYDGTVENIAVSPGADEYSLTLSHAPRLPLVTGDARYAKATYTIVKDDIDRPIHFIVSEKITKDNFTSTIRAGNYDPGFYQNDKDYINGLISEESII
jgi:hypothetical protein